MAAHDDLQVKHCYLYHPRLSHHGRWSDVERSKTHGSSLSWPRKNCFCMAIHCETMSKFALIWCFALVYLAISIKYTRHVPGNDGMQYDSTVSKASYLNIYMYNILYTKYNINIIYNMKYKIQYIYNIYYIIYITYILYNIIYII